MKTMKITAVIFALLAPAVSNAQAQCFGSDSFTTCTDQSGNTYNVQRFGNTTTMQGYNSRTGSSWNQQSQTFGGTTFHSGQAANGNSWNMQQNSYGGTTTYSGTDSSGQFINRTCGTFGCF